MRITVVAVGKNRDPGLRAAALDYEKRIRRYARIEEIEVKDGTEAEVAARLDRAVPERSRTIALEVEGRRLSSDELARYVGDAELSGTYGLAFVVGGSYGLPRAFRERADLQLSLSPMTLPHRLARVVLFEQIYRAFTILRREPYSH